MELKDIVRVYAANPGRTQAGADELLAELLALAGEAADLAIALRGEAPNTADRRRVLGIVRLRLLEAGILTQ